MTLRASNFSVSNACQYNFYDKIAKTSYGPRQANLVLIAYTSSEGSGSPEPPLLAHTSSESRGTFRQKARSLHGWACAVKICHDGMLEDTNLLYGAHMIKYYKAKNWLLVFFQKSHTGR